MVTSILLINSMFYICFMQISASILLKSFKTFQYHSNRECAWKNSAEVKIKWLLDTKVSNVIDA